MYIWHFIGKYVMIAFHKRNFPLHHCMAPAEIFVGRGGKPKKPPPPPWTWRKVAKNWQKGCHMNKKVPYKEKTLIFSKGGGLGPTLPPHAGVHVFIA